MSASKSARVKSTETTQILRAAMKEGKLAEVADLTGISKETFQGILGGFRSPSGNQRSKIKDAANALEIGCNPQ